jgi:hypothetical protein
MRKDDRRVLEFSRKRGNDLSTPQPAHGFPGLKPDDRWCLSAARWQEAFEAGAAPPVVLAATHETALEIVALEDLKKHAVDSAVSGVPGARLRERRQRDIPRPAGGASASRPTKRHRRSAVA